ncbi:hypothetical protein UY3_07094 [Chelonia mydas]|uniref:Uncharacterized protein n=1 Tax=Chelonia mydas TaxID=8469 RepID=M7BJ59_CHEMY|nr:hypothetical protein UY3_07094 [Chelonia mydas]
MINLAQAHLATVSLSEAWVQNLQMQILQIQKSGVATDEAKVWFDAKGHITEHQIRPKVVIQDQAPYHPFPKVYNNVLKGSNFQTAVHPSLCTQMHVVDNVLSTFAHIFEYWIIFMFVPAPHTCDQGDTVGTAYVAIAIDIFITCCARHNICEGKGECFYPEPAQDKSGLQTLYRQLDTAHVHNGPSSQWAQEIRDTIFAHILEQ